MGLLILSFVVYAEFRIELMTRNSSLLKPINKKMKNQIGKDQAISLEGWGGLRSLSKKNPLK